MAPGDSLRITTATCAKSQQFLVVTGTGTNPAVRFLVQNRKTQATMGAMLSLGNGN